MELASGTLLGERYALEEPIDMGGMAEVWRATDQVLDRPVAVKILHRHLADNPEFLERFRAEATASARLTHPHIVHVFDTGLDDGVAYIVMELFEGETLRQTLTERGTLPPAEAIEAVLPVLSALQHAHETGLIHRDVKPANILLAPDGRTKVTDFGIAKAMHSASDVTTTGKVLGSVAYMSPEQVEGNAVDPRSDVYACGALLYELLTGKPPFEAETDLAAAMMRLTRDPVPPGAVRAGIPRALDAIVMHALERRPEARFSSAEEMRLALQRLRSPTEAMPVARAPEPEGRAGWFRSWMLVPLLAVLAAAAAITVGLVIGKLQFGGPLGVETAKNNKASQVGHQTPYRFVDQTAYDPFGDGSENDADASLAADGDLGTYWQTEGYDQPDLGGLKPGVGLLFDLGQRRAVSGFRLTTPLPGFRFQVRVGDSPPAMTTGPSQSFTATGNLERSIQPRTGRYVLLWITQVVPAPDGKNRAEVGEFKAFGSGG